MIKDFLNQLRHRRVLRTAIAYAILLAAAIEFTDIVTPVLGLPEGLLRIVTVVGLVGFPVVIVLSWFFDFTSEGIVKGTSTPEPAVSRKANLVSMALIVLLTGTVGYMGYRLHSLSEAPQEPQGEKSIAVLPFSSLSDDASAETRYFSDGVAEEILNALSRVDGLRVAARTSSFALRGADVRAVGEELDVSMVLEGVVRRSGDQLRISAQLVDAASGFQLWSDVYDHQMEDVFRIQEEIAHSIVNALSLDVLDDGTRLVTPGTDSTQAYDKYLEGRGLLQVRTPAAAQRAVEMFNEALALDPDYAQAYTGLADSWIILREVGNLSLSEATQRSHSAITKALQLNKDLPEAQASLGLCILGGGRKSDAGFQFQKAIELDPEYADGHLLQANLLRDQGYLVQANQVYSRAVSLDPFNPNVMENMALLLAYQGRFDEAESTLQGALDIEPGRIATRLVASRIASLAGRFEQALEQAEQAAELAPQSPVALALVLDAHLRLGNLEEAESVLGQVREHAPKNETAIIATLRYYLLTGDYSSLDRIALSRLEPFLGQSDWAGTSYVLDGAYWAATARLAIGDSRYALELLEQSVTDVASLDPRPDSAQILSLMARAHLLEGDSERAVESANQARALLDRAENEGWGGSSVQYQRAVAAAALGEGEQALEHLREAIRLGWNDFVAARHDPVMTDVIRLPAWEALAQSGTGL